MALHQPRPRRRNQFFISRRKIDNFFWFLFSFLHPFFSLSHRRRIFSENYFIFKRLLFFLLLGEKQKETKHKKTIKKLKWCYNLWSVRDYNHTIFFSKNLFLMVFGRIEKWPLRQLMSSLRWQKEDNEERNWFRCDEGERAFCCRVNLQEIC